MSFQSPFDQPSYRPKKKAKTRKKAPAKKKVAKKVAKKRAPAKKSSVTKKVVRKKAPAHKKTKKTLSPEDFDTPKEWQGVPKDLRGMARLLNNLYFSKLAAFGKRPIVIEELKWGRVSVSRHGTCRYYEGGPKGGQVRIIINGQLRPDSVPAMVTAFTLFHEMVHAYCFKTGNKICANHDREYRKRERLFKGWEKVKEWRDRGSLFRDKDCHPFTVGQAVLHESGRFEVTGCAKGWIFIRGVKGGSYRARPHHLAAANPRTGAILPELEDDAEIVVWEGPNPGTILPELEDDFEVVKWKP